MFGYCSPTVTSIVSSVRLLSHGRNSNTYASPLLATCLFTLSVKLTGVGFSLKKKDRCWLLWLSFILLFSLMTIFYFSFEHFTFLWFLSPPEHSTPFQLKKNQLLIISIFSLTSKSLKLSQSFSVSSTLTLFHQFRKFAHSIKEINPFWACCFCSPSTR